MADKFGDLTKRTVAGLIGKDASEYKFGDITRKAFTNFTGKDLDEYEFGDLTRTALSAADGALADVRDRYFDDLPAALWKRLFVGLSQGQRDDCIYCPVCGGRDPRVLVHRESAAQLDDSGCLVSAQLRPIPHAQACISLMLFGPHPI